MTTTLPAGTGVHRLPRNQLEVDILLASHAAKSARAGFTDDAIQSLVAAAGPSLALDAVSLPVLPPKISLVNTTRAVGTAFTSDTQITDAITTRGRWELGINYQPLLGHPDDDTSLGTWAVCSTDTRRNKPFGERTEQASYTPYFAWAGDECSTYGFPAHYYAERALLRLALLDSFIIANELWDGALVRQENAAGNTMPNWFFSQVNGAAGVAANAATAEILNGGNAADPEAALGYLEDALARCLRGPVGFIHCTPGVLTQWQSHGQVHEVRDPVSGDATPESYLTSPMGNIVVADAGYSGHGPGGYPGGPTGANAAAAGAVWAYATSPVYVRRGNPLILGAPLSISPDGSILPFGGFDPDANDLKTIAERPVAAWWDDQCLFAVKVNAPYVAP